MSKTSVITRVLTIIAALGIVVAIYVPIWRIILVAPQYPEGLYMTISADKLGGEVDIINGLNHYIGMKSLQQDEFPEFKFLRYVLWLIVAFGLLTAIVNKRKLYYSYFGFFLLFSLLAMVDFYRWEYDYGHHLDPNAAIEVPGMSYQPPLVGHKQLLNFTAYSIPDFGGWVFLGSGFLLAVAFTIEFIRQRKEHRANRTNGNIVNPAVVASMQLIMISCTTGPDPIRFGKDNCDFCKMTIVDKKFGGEIITDKEKIFRFDDIKCIIDFLNAGSADKTTSTIYFLDYNGSGTMVRSDSALLMRSDQLRSPMGGNIAAFNDDAARNSVMDKLGGTAVLWGDLLK